MIHWPALVLWKSSLGWVLKGWKMLKLGHLATSNEKLLTINVHQILPLTFQNWPLAEWGEVSLYRTFPASIQGGLPARGAGCSFLSLCERSWRADTSARPSWQRGHLCYKWLSNCLPCWWLKLYLATRWNFSFLKLFSFPLKRGRLHESGEKKQNKRHSANRSRVSL